MRLKGVQAAATPTGNLFLVFIRLLCNVFGSEMFVQYLPNGFGQKIEMERFFLVFFLNYLSGKRCCPAEVGFCVA